MYGVLGWSVNLCLSGLYLCLFDFKRLVRRGEWNNSLISSVRVKHCRSSTQARSSFMLIAAIRDQTFFSCCCFSNLIDLVIY